VPGYRAGPANPNWPGDRASCAQYYLHPGHLFASDTPTLVTTILGSCVAVCLFDLTAKIGGVNHFLLPLASGRERTPRFGDVAIPSLIDQLLGLGAVRANLQAKVFGGACVVASFSGNRRHLGEENAELALLTLEAQGIPVLDGDVGGTRGRKLVFQTDEGTAWVRSL
jgi:chemotaxis protein CheD